MTRGQRAALLVSVLFWTGVMMLRWVPDVQHPVQVPRGLLVPATPLGPKDLRKPGACKQCHPVEWQTWSRSSHARAASGDLFRMGFRLEPRKWCLGCHAPEDPDPLHLESHPGVTCASCHLREGGVATSRPVSGNDSPHPLVHDPSLADGSTCRRCHQSDFPLNPGMTNQDTMVEWEKAGGAVLGRCVDCHMGPASGSGRAHDFPGTRDREFLKRSIPVSARLEREGSEDVLTITVGPARAGHRVPTGDPFRALAIEWEVISVTGDGPRGEILLGRFFDRRGEAGSPRIVEVADTRLHAGETRELRALLGLAPAGPRQVRVTASLRFLPRWMTGGADWPDIVSSTGFASLTVSRER